MAEKASREQRITRDRRREMGAIMIGILIAVVLGVGAWVSTFYHPAM